MVVVATAGSSGSMADVGGASGAAVRSPSGLHAIKANGAMRNPAMVTLARRFHSPNGTVRV